MFDFFFFLLFAGIFVYMRKCLATPLLNFPLLRDLIFEQYMRKIQVVNHTRRVGLTGCEYSLSCVTIGGVIDVSWITLYKAVVLSMGEFTPPVKYETKTNTYKESNPARRTKRIKPKIFSSNTAVDLSQTVNIVRRKTN